jgi:hypothetical protein
LSLVTTAGIWADAGRELAVTAAKRKMHMRFFIGLDLWV